MEQVKIHRIIRSKRKTVALVINPDAALIVRAPRYLPLDYIQQLVSKKSYWIKRKIDEIQSRPKEKAKEYIDGEEFLYLGRTYRLKIVDDQEVSVGEYLYLPRRMLFSAVENLKDWYKDKAKLAIEERAAWYAKQAGVEYKSIRITDAVKRLGSCSHKGSLNFSWRLILAPIQVIDYVVVHELVHLIEFNHSQRFWQKVRAIFPEHAQAKKWIKDNLHLLKIE